MIDYNITNRGGTGNDLTIQADWKTASDLGIIGNTAKTFAIFASSGAASKEILEAMATMTVAQIEEAVATMVPDTSAASAGAISISSGAMSTVSSHMKTARAEGITTGIATGDMTSGLNVWGQAYNTNADQNNIGDNKGYDSKGRGIVFGIDKQVDENTIYGVAFSVGANDVTSKNKVTKGLTDISSKQFTAYLSKTEGNFYMDGMVSYAINDNSGSRHVVIGGKIDRTALSSYDSQIMSAKVGGGSNINMNGYTLTPNISATYSAISSDSYKEVGGFNTNMSPQDMDKVTAVTGITLSKALKTT
jgi:outer membrane autotransporter protein